MEDGGGPWGDDSHDHASADEAQACQACRAFMGMVTGCPLVDQKPTDPEAEIAALRAKVEAAEADNLRERERYADMVWRVVEATGLEPTIGMGAVQAVEALRAKVERLEGEASKRIGPGSPVARWRWLMDELERLLGDPKPYSSHPPEARYVERIERLEGVVDAARGDMRMPGDRALLWQAIDALDAGEEEKCK